MSRIGKKIITLPTGVSCIVKDRLVTVKGPKGELSLTHVPGFTISQGDNTLSVVLTDDAPKGGSALWGLTRALIQNMIDGVTKGFSKSLEINGVGFKVAAQGSKITLNVGYSHPVYYELPEGITAVVEKNIITISGIDKQLVGQVAAEIRGIKKPEPYKGKGIKYTDEVIRRKVGKVLKSTA